MSAVEFKVINTIYNIAKQLLSIEQPKFRDIHLKEVKNDRIIFKAKGKHEQISVFVLDYNGIRLNIDSIIANINKGVDTKATIVEVRVISHYVEVYSGRTKPTIIKHDGKLYNFPYAQRNMYRIGSFRRVNMNESDIFEHPESEVYFERLMRSILPEVIIETGLFEKDKQLEEMLKIAKEVGLVYDLELNAFNFDKHYVRKERSEKIINKIKEYYGGVLFNDEEYRRMILSEKFSSGPKELDNALECKISMYAKVLTETLNKNINIDELIINILDGLFKNGRAYGPLRKFENLIQKEPLLQ